jgi:hypothetical protein
MVMAEDQQVAMDQARTVGRPMAALVAAVLFSGSALAHDSGPGSWIRNGNFISPLDGAHCCGEHDCFALDPDDVREAAGGYLIRSLDELVPPREVQWSRDGRYWRCRKADGTRRCFFAPPPAS